MSAGRIAEWCAMCNKYSLPAGSGLGLGRVGKAGKRHEVDVRRKWAVQVRG